MINATLHQDSDNCLKLLNAGAQMGMIAALGQPHCLPWNVSGTQQVDALTPYVYAVCTYLPYPVKPYATADSIWGSITRE